MQGPFRTDTQPPSLPGRACSCVQAGRATAGEARVCTGKETQRHSSFTVTWPPGHTVLPNRYSPPAPFPSSYLPADNAHSTHPALPLHTETLCTRSDRPWPFCLGAGGRGSLSLSLHPRPARAPHSGFLSSTCLQELQGGGSCFTDLRWVSSSSKGEKETQMREEQQILTPRAPTLCRVRGSLNIFQEQRAMCPCPVLSQEVCLGQSCAAQPCPWLGWGGQDPSPLCHTAAVAVADAASGSLSLT